MADDNRQAAKNAAKSASELRKQKKKKWCPIVAPELFQNKFLGESLVDDASLLMNKAITVNLMQLTGDMKKQNMTIMFKVVDIKEGKGITKAIKFELASSSLKRFPKREKDKRIDSFVVKTADNVLVRIKPIMITNAMTKGSALRALIKNCRGICKEYANQTTFDNLLMDLVAYKFQKTVRELLHKTYPLRNFEIKSLSVETKKKKETVEEELLMKMKKEQERKQKEKEESFDDDNKDQSESQESEVEDVEESQDEEDSQDTDDSETVEDEQK